LRDNSEKQMSCQNGGYDSDGVRHCEMREQTVPAIGRLSVDAHRNGGVTVKGWLRNEVLVRARVEASAENEGAAANVVSRVSIDSSGGQVRATGPESVDNNNSWWSVSYEIFVPQNIDLTATARNGGITISDVRGQIRFEGRNGGVHLKRLAGDVSGSTVNGGVQMELTGTIWDGRQLEVTTRNGGVSVTMPSSYSARIQAESERGGFQSDFPVTVQGNVRPRRLDFNVGAGGPLIHVTTTNGRVSFTRAESQ
jgi:DUF4097 and DUF4098 domain-containing protein YvlB